MMSRRILRPLLVLILGVCTSISALPQMPNPYGQPISLVQAKKAAAPAIAEVLKMNLTVAVAVVDTSGNLVYYEKMNNTQLGSAHVAISKARSSAVFKRPTKVFEDVLTAGGSGLVFSIFLGSCPLKVVFHCC
jgi:glc operon protein GlcG